MDKEQQLTIEYFQQKKAYEEKEDNLIHKQNKAIEDLREVAKASEYYLNRFTEESSEALLPSIHALNNMEDEIRYLCKKDREKIEQALDELELDYRKKQRKLFDHEK